MVENLWSRFDDTAEFDHLLSHVKHALVQVTVLDAEDIARSIVFVVGGSLARFRVLVDIRDRPAERLVLLDQWAGDILHGMRGADQEEAFVCSFRNLDCGKVSEANITDINDHAAVGAEALNPTRQHSLDIAA